MNKRKNCNLIAIYGLLAGFLLAYAMSPIEASQVNSKTYQFINGRWFNGRGFKPATFYAVNGALTSRRPSRIDESVDLANGFVIPPFGDAHCHHFDSERGLENLIRGYLKEGIFYAKVLANWPEGANKTSTKLNRADSVDVLFANGCLTGSFSHPMGIYEGMTLGFYTWQQRYDHREEIRDSRRAEGQAYYNIDSVSELESKFPRLLATKPGIIKIILTDSENYERDKNNTEMDSRRGLNPQLAPLVIKKAHAAGLRVSAHVDTAADFHLALASGVDEMAHLPGYYISAGEDIKKYELSEADVKLAARRKVIVTPTANLSDDFIPDEKQRAKVRVNQIRNLTLLKKHGVQIAIGADFYGTSASKEAFYLYSLGLYSNLELLKIWCETMPQNIFPQRKLGRLQEGYEASFVLLAADPLEKFESVKQINYRFKQGLELR
jgi:hypothetical protein